MSINSNNNEVIPTETTTEFRALPIPEPTEYAVKVKPRSFIQTIPERIPAFGEIMFSLSSIIIKVMTNMHSVEVLVFRCSIQFIPFFILTLKERHPIFGIPGQRIDLALRCVSGTFALVPLYMAFRLMPLSDASTIFSSSPIFTTIFAYFLLKEPITLIHGLTGVLTVIGVFIISKPEFIFGKDEIDDIYEHRILGIILASVAAISASVVLINLRKLKTTPVPVVVMWYSMTCVITGIVLVPILDKWVMPSNVYQWLMLFAIGLAGMGQQYFLTIALKYESPGPIAVARSINIVLAFIWEVVIFIEPIEWTSILGACLVILCIAIIALVKCYQENPNKIKGFYKKICFVFVSKKEKDINSVLKSCLSTQTSIVSIEQTIN